MAVRFVGVRGGYYSGGVWQTEARQYISNWASDKVVAGRGNNDLYGFKGNDTLYGNAGKDVLSGGLGRDKLYGGKGADYFLFDKAPGKKNVDRVMDFSRKQGDKVALVYKYFKEATLEYKYDKAGKTIKDKRLDIPVARLSKDSFALGEKALLETDRIVYNKSRGALYYDKDGSGALDPVKIATFKPGTNLTWSDFLFF